MRLIERAGLNQIAPDGCVASPGDQYKAIRQAARGIAIDDGVNLAEFLCTYPLPCPSSCCGLARLRHPGSVARAARMAC